MSHPNISNQNPSTPLPSIGFNKPHFTGSEIKYIQEAISSSKIGSNGDFTQKCQQFFESKYGFKKVFLTPSCTDALEMCALLINTKEGDEIIVPSYTFVSTANAFILQGAKIVFADSESNSPNIDTATIEALITPKTKAIVCVHYAGMACDMERLMNLCTKHQLYLIEDAAQAIDSFYQGKALGSIGHLAAFSFHETKNITCGEGGMLVINDERLIPRAEIIREYGTNRSQFIRGEVAQYGWIDKGSSNMPSELLAAFLYAQLECLSEIQAKRILLWNQYEKLLKPLQDLGLIQLPEVSSSIKHNAHIFYIICQNKIQRTALINALKAENINAVFHYNALHQSTYFKDKHDGRNLPNSDKYTDCLLRLPLYYDLTLDEVQHIATIITQFLKTNTL